MRFRILIICSVIFSSPAIAQTEIDPVLEPIIESVAENVDESFDYSELTEKLNYYYRNKINLNRITSEQLEELSFLSPLQISSLINYRQKNGDYINVLELQTIDGLDPETIKKLLLFVALQKADDLKNLSLREAVQNSHNDFLIRYGQVLEKQKGFITADDPGRSHYLGSPFRLFARYRYNYDPHLSLSLNMDKDAGEGFLSSAQKKGFDFYSASLFVKNAGRFKKIIAGDYSLQFGQGLTLWSGLSFGKGSVISVIPKQGSGLKPYTSTNEMLFLRGGAATIEFGKLDFTPFISYHKIDASVSADNEIISLSQTGYHRTSSEIENRGSLAQLVYGFDVQYKTNKLGVGMAAYQTQYDHQFERGTKPYQLFEFSEDKLTNTGFYYHYNLQNLYVFGEAAHSFGSGWAFLNGILASLSPRVSLVLLHRSYQRNYHSFFNQALAEATDAVNENGFYSGLVISPSAKIEWSAYADLFKFPWLKYQADAPSKGYELFSRIVYTPSKELQLQLRYRLKNKQQNDNTGTSSILADGKKQNYRLELAYTVNDKLSLRNRAEMIQYRSGNQKYQFGYLLFQDINYSPVRKIAFTARIAIFDTDGYDSRIYAYENDVIYSYSFPAYQNEGLRFYFNTRYRIGKGLNIWLRYALSSYTDLDQVGSSLDISDGNRRSDIKIQLRYQF